MTQRMFPWAGLCDTYVAQTLTSSASCPCKPSDIHIWKVKLDFSKKKKKVCRGGWVSVWDSPEPAQGWGADRSHFCPGLRSSFLRKRVFLGCWSFSLAAAQGNRSGLRHLVLSLIGVRALPSGHVFPECRGVHHSWQLPEPAAQHLSPLSRWALWIQVCHSCGYRYKLASALWASPELSLVSRRLCQKSQVLLPICPI